jgi:hypothetical protein
LSYAAPAMPHPISSDTLYLAIPDPLELYRILFNYATPYLAFPRLRTHPVYLFLILLYYLSCKSGHSWNVVLFFILKHEVPTWPGVRLLFISTVLLNKAIEK